MSEELLTQDEVGILGLITEAVNRFAALPEHHPEDVREWCTTVHVLQRQVMARAARRAYPLIFRPMVASDPAVATDNGL